MWHRQIKQYETNSVGVCAEYLDAFMPVGGGENAETHSLQHVAGQITHHQLIVNDKSQSIGMPVVAYRDRWMLFDDALLRCREKSLECRTLARLAVHLDGSAVSAHDPKH